MPEPTHMVISYVDGHVAMYLNDESPVGEVLTRGSVEHCSVVPRAELGRSCPCGCELDEEL